MATWVNETSQKTGGNITMKVAGGYANVTRNGNTVSGNIGIRFIPSQWTYNSVAGWYGGQRRWAQRSGGGTHTATNAKYYANATDNPAQNYQNKTEVTPWSFSTTVSGTGAGNVTLSIGAGWNAYNPSNGYTKKFDVPYPALTSYTISYNANGGTSTPGSQTKYDGIDLTISGAISHNDTTQNGYTVSFNANGGSVSPTSKTATDTVGWSFSSWKSSATGTTWSAGATNFSENNTTTLTAQWSTSIKSRGAITTPSATRSSTTSTRTVTFNANNGSTTKTSQNSTATVTYSSTGWWTATSGGTKRCDNGGSYTPGSAETLYSQWSSSTGSFSAVTLPTATECTRAGYNLLGWSTSSTATTASYSPGASYTPSASIILYAVWQLAQATVWVKVNGTWVKGKVWYKNSSGTWVKCQKFYTKQNGSWVENKTTA